MLERATQRSHQINAGTQTYIILNRYQGGMCISGVLKMTERTTLNLISPLDPSRVATGSAV